jgi:hypothetical protein
MEQMMRAMESTMSAIDVDNDMQKMMMSNMVRHMTMMQMYMIMNTMK